MASLGPSSRAGRSLTPRLASLLASALLGACSGAASDDALSDGADPLIGMSPEAAAPARNSAGPSTASPAPSTPSPAGSELPPEPAGLDTSGASAGAMSSDGEGTDGENAEGSASDAEGDTPGAAAPDVADSDHCAPVSEWDAEWIAFEEAVLELVNEVRSSPADCGAEGQFPAAPPLTMDPILRCSARLHSLDMFERDFFDHVTPDGVDPFERMALAGFAGSGGGENIAVGQSTPEEVMQAWMDSDGHCANVMRAGFSTIGIGFHPGEGRRGLGSNYWTQNFGAPPFMRGRAGTPGR